MAEDSVALWREALAECDNIEKFNDWALPAARDRRAKNPQDGFARMVAAEAIHRGYRYTGDRLTGCYVDLEPGDYQMVVAELERREHKESVKRLWKRVRSTKVSMVKAAWEEWIYKAESAEGIGALVIQDLRKRKDNRYFYEFDMVPETLFKRLFQADAKEALKQIFTIFGSQQETETRNWKEAI